MPNTAKSANNSQLKLRKLTFSALYLALAMVLPFLTGQIPQIGSALCPMHFPALLCGFMCGWPWGLAVGLIAPVLRSAIWGMPPMFPVAVAMAFELAAYGLAAGLLYKIMPKFTGRLFVILIISMVFGRIVWGGVRFALAGLSGSAFTIEMMIAGAVTTAIPGIIAQIALIPPLVAILTKAGLNLNKAR